MAVSSTVRSIIELFCKILGDHGISDVRAETLRQGKFNRDLSAKLMWRVLYDVVCFLDKRLNSVLHSPEGTQIPYVKARLQNWGYLSKTFAELPISLAYGSREILLALGWVIHSQHLVDEIIHRKISPLNQDLLSFTIGVDVKESHPIRQLRSLPQKEKLQRQLMLCGKLKLKLRRLFASQQELAHLHQTIQNCTVGVSVQPEINHLTPLEVYLLRYPESLSTMLCILEEDNAKLKRLLDWREKDQIFWDWMSSVLDLHTQEQAGEREQQGQEHMEEESVFLDTPLDIGEQISTLRAHIRDFILGHEEDIETLEKLVMNKKISRIDLELINRQVEKELFELSRKFSQYEKGWFDVPARLDSGIEASIDKCDSVPFDGGMNSIARKGQKLHRYVPQTAQNVKAAKEAETTHLVQKEISTLQIEVETLEQELKQAQVNHLKKLQSIADNDLNSICILPRHFKQFLNS